MSWDQDHVCNTGLSLDLLGFNTTSNSSLKKLERPLKLDHVVYPGLSLGPIDQGFSVSPGSSSYSNNDYSISVKRSLDREKEFGGSHGEEVEVDKVSSRVSDEEEEEDQASPRKKLRLNKDQAAVLEDSFKEHSTLNPNQKQALAKRLNLRPRQVEVWFQNRRARTKLKQTEMDYELLKKCCETLTEENKRLQKEVNELKNLKLATPVYMQVPAPTLSMCPSCERFITTTTAPPVPGDHHRRRHLTPSPQGGTANVFPNMNGTKTPQFFTHPSAAC